MPILLILRYNGSLATWTVGSLTTAKFKSYVFYVWFHIVLCCEHVHCHDYVWLLLLTCTILSYNRIHTEGWKLCANSRPVCTLENVPWYVEPCFAGATLLNTKSVGQSVLVSSTNLGPNTRFWLLSDICWFVDVGRPVWREDGSIIYNYLPSPTQPFSVPGSVGLMTIICSLRFETS
jgi:hypothetical protein